MTDITLTLTDDEPDQVAVLVEGTAADTPVEVDMAPHEYFIRLSIEASVASPVFPHGEHSPLLVSALGWSREEAARVRGQLAAFEEDWDAPGMSAYDAL